MRILGRWAILQQRQQQQLRRRIANKIKQITRGNLNKNNNPTKRASSMSINSSQIPYISAILSQLSRKRETVFRKWWINSRRRQKQRKAGLFDRVMYQRQKELSIHSTILSIQKGISQSIQGMPSVLLIKQRLRKWILLLKLFPMRRLILRMNRLPARNKRWGQMQLTRNTKLSTSKMRKRRS